MSQVQICACTRTFKDNRDKTLNDIKEQNEDLLTLNDALNINETKSLEARDARKGSLEQAKEYARQYAINPSVKYQYFNQDCTNFASQILYEGWGMSTTSEWNTWSSSELAQRNRRVAHDFAEYWSVIKGYNGGVLPTREQVNQQANPGDFLAYMSRNTGVITHIAFVQEKRAGYIYVSQHTTNLYDAMFNQRVSESDMQNKYHIILIDFT